MTPIEIVARALAPRDKTALSEHHYAAAGRVIRELTEAGYVIRLVESAADVDEVGGVLRIHRLRDRVVR